MCLAQAHNTVTPVKLESAVPCSQVKHSTTEPLRYLNVRCSIPPLTVKSPTEISKIQGMIQGLKSNFPELFKTALYIQALICVNLDYP